MATPTNPEHFTDADIAEHRETLQTFVAVLKYSLTGIAIVLLGLALWGG
jgi:Bacterial aa3 type cytochrome c oxidase subunit IV